MNSSTDLAKPGSPLSVAPFAHPLDEFYAQAGRPFPHITRLSGDEVPEPYKQLLVHKRDMTPTLKAYYKDTIEVEVLRRDQRGDFYSREVLLVLRGTRQVVEFGAIKINLILLSPPVRREILEERAPLGEILEKHEIEHSSRPKAYLQVKSDDFIGTVFKLSQPQCLYGRRNTLSDPADRAIAEIVEILPPAS